MEQRYLIAGLGNPGPRYVSNRHNVGFRCVERLTQAHGLAFDKRQKQAQVGMGTILGARVILAKPQTYMNESGRAVGALVRFYKVPVSHLLVVYDDLDLPWGAVRLRPEGGSGGHKGMRSIIQSIGSRAFPRLRIGIGRPPGRMDPAAYVLQDFSTEEEADLEEILDHAAVAVETWIRRGVDVAMSQYNRSAVE